MIVGALEETFKVEDRLSEVPLIRRNLLRAEL
jgi:hypothetical protein